ncbi:Beta-secretase 2 [Galemys pyrenaicus]|uniref:Beta-secretase 2 n=1 Tax=Galemys pyrenaicus TaxID=202257 RepID=A0A8J6DRY2_GALPY|nr:Beta-secretase 2 [Galemys pyrenaicus]
MAARRPAGRGLRPEPRSYQLALLGGGLGGSRAQPPPPARSASPAGPPAARPCQPCPAQPSPAHRPAARARRPARRPVAQAPPPAGTGRIGTGAPPGPVAGMDALARALLLPLLAQWVLHTVPALAPAPFTLPLRVAAVTSRGAASTPGPGPPEAPHTVPRADGLALALEPAGSSVNFLAMVDNLQGDSGRGYYLEMLIGTPPQKSQPATGRITFRCRRGSGYVGMSFVGKPRQQAPEDMRKEEASGGSAAAAVHMVGPRLLPLQRAERAVRRHPGASTSQGQKGSATPSSHSTLDQNAGPRACSASAQLLPKPSLAPLVRGPRSWLGEGRGRGAAALARVALGLQGENPAGSGGVGASGSGSRRPVTVPSPQHSGDHLLAVSRAARCCKGQRPGPGQLVRSLLSSGRRHRLQILVDTGSSNFAVAGAPHAYTDAYFDADRSSTYRPRGFDVTVKYTQGSWTGSVGEDVVTIPKGLNSSFLVNIATIFESENFFLPGIKWNGILGLAYATLAKVRVPVGLSQAREWTLRTGQSWADGRGSGPSLGQAGPGWVTSVLTH